MRVIYSFALSLLLASVLLADSSVQSGAAQDASTGVVKGSAAMQSQQSSTQAEIEALERQITPLNAEESQRQIEALKRQGEIQRLELLISDLEASDRTDELEKARTRLIRLQEPTVKAPVSYKPRVAPVAQPVQHKAPVANAPASDSEGGAK